METWRDASWVCRSSCLYALLINLKDNAKALFVEAWRNSANCKREAPLCCPFAQPNPVTRGDTLLLITWSFRPIRGEASILWWWTLMMGWGEGGLDNIDILLSNLRQCGRGEAYLAGWGSLPAPGYLQIKSDIICLLESGVIAIVQFCYEINANFTGHFTLELTLQWPLMSPRSHISPGRGWSLRKLKLNILSSFSNLGKLKKRKC